MRRAAPAFPVPARLRAVLPVPLHKVLSPRPVSAPRLPQKLPAFLRRSCVENVPQLCHAVFLCHILLQDRAVFRAVAVWVLPHLIDTFRLKRFLRRVRGSRLRALCFLLRLFRGGLFLHGGFLRFVGKAFFNLSPLFEEYPYKDSYRKQ